jgi:hypothetical protein
MEETFVGVLAAEDVPDQEQRPKSKAVECLLYTSTEVLRGESLVSERLPASG